MLITVKLVRKYFNPEFKIEGVLWSMYDVKTNFDYKVNEETKKYFKKIVYNTIIYRNVRLFEKPSYDFPITDYDQKSTGSKIYMDIAKEVAALHVK